MYIQVNFNKQTQDVVLADKSKPRSASAIKYSKEVCGYIYITGSEHIFKNSFSKRVFHNRNAVNVNTLNMCLYMFQP